MSHIGGVATQHNRANARTATVQRQRAQRHVDAFYVHITHARRTACHHERERLIHGDISLIVNEGCRDLTKYLAFELTAETEFVHCRECVRACEGNNSFEVQPDKTVGRTRRTPTRKLRRLGVRKLRIADHLEQVISTFAERRFLAGQLPGSRQVGVSADNGDRMRRTHIAAALASLRKHWSGG